MMHKKSTETVSQMISDGFAAPLADLGQAPIGPMEMPNKGVRDEGSAGGVPVKTTEGRPTTSAPGRRGKRDGRAPELGKDEESQGTPSPTFPPGVLDLSAYQKPLTRNPEMCSTPGTWSSDNCSLGSSADVAPDDWRMLTPGTWCPNTTSPDSRKGGSSEFWPDTNTSLSVPPKQIDFREVNCSGAASISTPVYVVASVCVRISGRVFSTRRKRVLLAVLPSIFPDNRSMLVVRTTWNPVHFPTP